MQKIGPIGKLIGIRVTASGKGTAECSLTAKIKHLNPVGRIHGGILCDLADAAMGYAFLSELPQGRTGVATNLQISFTHAVRPGDRLKAKAKTLSRGRSIAFMECEIRNQKGCFVAKASSTCKILPAGKN